MMIEDATNYTTTNSRSKQNKRQQPISTAASTTHEDKDDDYDNKVRQKNTFHSKHDKYNHIKNNMMIEDATNDTTTNLLPNQKERQQPISTTSTRHEVKNDDYYNKVRQKITFNSKNDKYNYKRRRLMIEESTNNTTTNSLSNQQNNNDDDDDDQWEEDEEEWEEEEWEWEEEEITITNHNNHHHPRHTIHILPTAQMIDSNTESIVFAKEETNQILVLKKNIYQIIIIFIGLLFVGGIIILWRASSKGDSIHLIVGDERCWNSSLDEQNAAIQCYCTGTAQTAADNVDKNGLENYEYVVDVLANHSIIPSNYISKLQLGKCDSINLSLLMMASSTLGSMSPILVQMAPDKIFIQFYMLSYIYVTMNGMNWYDTTNWFTSIEFCNWYGVECSFVEITTKISLSNNNLIGTIPSEIHYFEGLIEFDISFNPGITGTIPKQLMQLTSLHVLNLSNLNLNGTIPYQLNKLHRLRILSLQNNNLIGTIPSKLFLNTNLNMDENNNNNNNYISDTDDGLQSLTVLNFENNLLNGTIPKEIGYVTNLINLQLSNNYLEGTIPIEISKLTLLESLNIANNQFSSSQKNIQKMTMMMIPNELGYLQYLKYIALYKSGFSNTIPETFCAYNDNIMIESNNNQNQFQQGMNYTTTRGTRYIVIDCDHDHDDNNNNDKKIDYCSCCNEGSTSSNNNKIASIHLICSENLIKNN